MIRQKNTINFLRYLPSPDIKRKYLIMNNARNIAILLIFALSVSSTSLKAICSYEQLIEGENLQIGTMLTWSTSFEENNAMFIIEKSEDGIHFTNIGSVDGSGDSNDLKEYSFLDVMASQEQLYYRLKQVDLDGAFSYSDVTTIQQKFKNNFMVARMSNVATQDEFNVTIDAFKDGELTYEVANWKKEQIFNQKMIVINGLNDLNVNLVDQAEGIYKLHLSMDGEYETLVIKKIADEINSKSNFASKAKPDKSKN